MENIIKRLRQKKGEPIFVNFPNGDCVIYAQKGSLWNPYCKHCWNSLVVKIYEEPYNQFKDCEGGYCDKCSLFYPIRRIEI